MAHIQWKKIKNHWYAYLYKSYRDPETGKVKKKYIRYVGKKVPKNIPKKVAGELKQSTAPRKTRIRLKGKQGRKLRGRRPKACMLPINQKCRYPRCIRWACQYYQPVVKTRRKKTGGK